MEKKIRLLVTATNRNGNTTKNFSGMTGNNISWHLHEDTDKNVCTVRTVNKDSGEGEVTTGEVEGVCKLYASISGNTHVAGTIASVMEFPVNHQPYFSVSNAVPTSIGLGGTFEVSAKHEIMGLGGPLTFNTDYHTTFKTHTCQIISRSDNSVIVQAQRAGSCKIVVQQPRTNINDEPTLQGMVKGTSNTSVTKSIDIKAMQQSIQWQAPSTIEFIENGNYSLKSAAYSSSGLPISYTTESSNVCQIDSGSTSISLLGLGNCVILANQGGDGLFGIASTLERTITLISVNSEEENNGETGGNGNSGNGGGGSTGTTEPELPVNKIKQFIFITSNLEITASINQVIDMQVNASSGLPVMIQAESACTIESSAGDSAQIVMNGKSELCRIHLQQLGNELYEEALEVVVEIKVVRQSQTINVITSAPIQSHIGSYFVVEANASSELPVTISGMGGCSGTGIETVSIDVTNAINCTVRFSQKGNEVFYRAIDIIQVVDILNIEDLEEDDDTDQLTLEELASLGENTKRAFVNTVRLGTGDCSSWINACDSIQLAIDNDEVNEIWLTEGTFRPSATITLKSPLRIIGGFNGSELTIQEKTVGSVSTISGDLLADDHLNQQGLLESVDNIVGTNLDQLFLLADTLQEVISQAVLSDLILSGVDGEKMGGGISASNSRLALDNVIFRALSGSNGGALAILKGSEIIVNGSTFINNRSHEGGGAIYIDEDNSNAVSIYGSLFIENVGGDQGGAINFEAGHLRVSNTTFAGNTLTNKDGNGGGIYVAAANDNAISNKTVAEASEVSLTYTTFIHNVAGMTSAAFGRGGGIFVSPQTLTQVSVANSLILDNRAYRGANIADASHMIDDGYNIIGFNGSSGAVDSDDAIYEFVGSSSTAPSTELDQIIIEADLISIGIPLTANSYARDYIPNTHPDCAAMKSGDQRGVIRPDQPGRGCDVGAFELTDADIEAFRSVSDSSNADDDNDAEGGSINSFSLFIAIILMFSFCVARRKNRS